ncbi:hypothetical protein [Nocardioides albus]|uniref:Uncharacterized protein n=1 Tax=Nocardioides albus TaxID=1841 RepID=A0A7W5FA83_9ACTN|nr:hypothetical protein [Nocardioides albus]MBB3090852.1 hypothetical protein [Nocardioides albus]GGU37924.1 hypothetical protein GCM10007979_41260 [Nocardioides albus]
MTDPREQNDWTIDVPWHDFRVEVQGDGVGSAAKSPATGHRLIVEPDGVVAVRDLGGVLVRMESGELTCFMEGAPGVLRWRQGDEHLVDGRCWWRNDSTLPAVIRVERDR